MTVVSLNTEREKRWDDAAQIAEDYFDTLVSFGWGLYRIGEAHQLEPYFPAGKGMMPDCTTAKGIWTQERIKDQLTIYIYKGGDFVI